MRIAVTGAGGRLGGQVVALLAADSDQQVVAVSRRSIRNAPPAANVSTALADYTDLPALRAALKDVDTLVFISSDGDAARVLLHHQNVVQAAEDTGVAHVVALSGLDIDLESPFCYAVTNGHTEHLLSASGCRVTVARASIFTEFFLHWIMAAGTTGQIRVPAGAGRISLVARADVGRCLAALAATPTGRHHDITGPEALDLTSLAALAEAEWRTPIRYVDLTPAEYCVEAVRSGLEPWWLYAYSTFFDSVREQRWTAVSPEVRRLTGRSPLPVHDILAQHKPPTPA